MIVNAGPTQSRLTVTSNQTNSAKQLVDIYAVPLTNSATGRTRQRYAIFQQVRCAVENLRQVNANILGVVPNSYRSEDPRAERALHTYYYSSYPHCLEWTLPSLPRQRYNTAIPQ